MSPTLSQFAFQVSLLKIPVTNIGQSVAFYRDALGMTEEFAAEEYGWAQLAAGDISLALYVPGMGGGNGEVGRSIGFHLALSSPQFEELASNLKERGALSEDRIHQGNDGSTFIDVLDPDGNVLKVMKAD